MIPILYGSQTGTAMFFSHLTKRAIEHGYSQETIYDMNSFLENKDRSEKCIVLEMDAFDVEKVFDVDFIIFVCSTHGDGTEPFNMSRFWSFLSQSDFPPDIFGHLSFAVFGLGDSSYEKYNYCSKRLFNRLKMLGAKPAIIRGAGDSQDIKGHLTGFQPWLLELVTYLRGYKSTAVVGDFRKKEKAYTSELVDKRRLTPNDHVQNIVELRFSIPEYTDFEPGDCLSFSPENYNYKEFMHYNSISYENLDDNVSKIKNVIDFNSCPHQPFFFALEHFLKHQTNITEEIVLKVGEICKDYRFYYEYISKPKRTIFEVIKELGIRLDIFFIMDFIPRIYPRFFTATKRNGFYCITVAIVNYFTSIREQRRSICSEYFLNLPLNYKLDVGIGKSNLYFDSNKLLFICTGVGVSLPRACVNKFVEKEITVFYGFRYREKDFLYEEEWMQRNVRMYTAASRKDGVYIQDVFMRNRIEDIDQYLVFVSGSSRLNKEVTKLLQEMYGRKIAFQSETW